MKQLEGFVSAGGAKQLGLQRRRLEEGSIAKVYEGGEFNRKSGGRIMNQTQLNYNKQRFI